MTDNIQQRFQTIEFGDELALLGLAEGFKMFIDLLGEVPEIVRFAQSLDEEKTRLLTLSRIVDVSRIQIDRKYRNPRDIALAVYIWAIWKHDTSLGESAAELSREVPNLWWADLMSQEVLARRRTVTVSQESGFLDIKSDTDTHEVSSSTPDGRLIPIQVEASQLSHVGGFRFIMLEGGFMSFGDDNIAFAIKNEIFRNFVINDDQIEYKAVKATTITTSTSGTILNYD
jgi:hypothetical protein